MLLGFRLHIVTVRHLCDMCAISVRDGGRRVGGFWGEEERGEQIASLDLKFFLMPNCCGISISVLGEISLITAFMGFVSGDLT